MILFFRKAFTNLSENFSVLTKAGYSIIGVSADKVKSQSSFSSKFGGFPYPLLADTEKKIINSFGVWGFKKFMGKEYEGILRISYLINEKGFIEKAYPKVKVKEHAQEVLGDIN